MTDDGLKINHRQQVFVDEYLKCFNGTEAARRAGYSAKSARQTASDLLKEPRISFAIDEKMKNGEHINNIGSAKRKISNLVYLIGAENGLTKIGITNNIFSRFSGLNTSSPVELSLVFYFEAKDAAKTERLLHDKYAVKRVKGEWFNLSVEDVDWIKENSGNL